MEASKIPLEETIESKIQQLPPHLQSEVVDFIDFLLEKTSTEKKKPLQFSWVGGLKKYRDKYTALELQKRACYWID